MSLDDAIQQMTDIIKAACVGAELKIVKMSDEEARLSVYAPQETFKRSRMRPLNPRSIC